MTLTVTLTNCCNATAESIRVNIILLSVLLKYGIVYRSKTAIYAALKFFVIFLDQRNLGKFLYV